MTMRLIERLHWARRFFTANPAARVSVLASASVALLLAVMAAGTSDVGAFVGHLPSFQGLLVPADGNSLAYGISGDGQVVLGGPDGGGCGEAVSWTRNLVGTFRLNELGLPGGGSCSFANSANSNGTVFGGIGTNMDLPYYSVSAPVIWVNGTSTLLPQNYNCCGNPPPPCGAGVDAINANAVGLTNSVLVGQDGSGSPGCGPGIPVEWVNGNEVAFLSWSPPQSGNAYGVNADGSVIVGVFGGNAFRWTSSDGTTPQLLGDFGGNAGTAYATSADGSVVVGTAAVNNVASRPFRWTAGTGLVGLCPAQVFASAYAVSADGSVVVGQTGNNGRAFRWTAATGCQTIQDLLTTAGVNLSGWNLTEAVGISADGSTIVGIGSNGVTSEAWIARLPVAHGLQPRGGGVVLKPSVRM